MDDKIVYILPTATLVIAGITFVLQIIIAITAIIKRAKHQSCAAHVIWLRGISVWCVLAGLVNFSHSMARTLLGHSLGGAPILDLWKWESRNYGILRLWMILALIGWTCALLLAIRRKTKRQQSPAGNVRRAAVEE